MPKSFAEVMEEHTKEDHAFQSETRLFNEDMAIFKAESEGSFSALHDKLDLLLEEIKDIKKTLEPISQAYDGLIFGRKLVTGLASVVLGIGAIGAGVIWLVNASIHRQ